MTPVDNTPADKFDTAIDKWIDSLNEPWNRLKYTIIRANLARHLTRETCSILDIGGGSGTDSIPLALQGHHVTLVDYSEKMVDEAKRLAQANGVEGRMTFHHADLTALPGLFPEPCFDVVLCHNVLQYVDDMPAAIKRISQPLKPSGIISVIALNRYSESLQAAMLRMDMEEAYNKLDATEAFTVVFDTAVKRFAGEEVIEALNEAGCDLLGHYGVRCVIDYLYDNERKFDPEFYSKLERLELAMSDRYPYYLIARFFQIIARKR